MVLNITVRVFVGRPRVGRKAALILEAALVVAAAMSERLLAGPSAHT